MKARRNLLRAGAAAAVLALAGLLPPGLASAQQKLVMKASDVHPLGYPTVEAVQNMGKKLEKATNGRLSIQMYASMQLGGEKEAIEQAQVGAIQFARVSVGALGPVIDELNVFNMPYLFRNTAHMQKVIDGPIGQELMDKVTNNPKAGLVALCWMDAGARSLYDTKKAIRNIDDLKGMKIRTTPNPARTAIPRNAVGCRRANDCAFCTRSPRLPFLMPWETLSTCSAALRIYVPAIGRSASNSRAARRIVCAIVPTYSAPDDLRSLTASLSLSVACDATSFAASARSDA